MSKADKLYSDSPRIERDKDTGETSVVKPSEVEDTGEEETTEEVKEPSPENIIDMLERHKQEVSALLTAKKETK